MALAAKLDEWGKAGWIALTILGFLLFWPVGLGLLGFLICSGRLRAWRDQRWRNQQAGSWHYPAHEYADSAWRNPHRQAAASSFNPARDVRAETRHWRDAEQRDCEDYLRRLRQARDKRARDKAELHRFTKERRGPATPGRPDAIA